MGDVDDDVEFVETNVGKMPIEDYRDILAAYYGYDSYEKLIKAIKRGDLKREELE